MQLALRPCAIVGVAVLSAGPASSSVRLKAVPQARCHVVGGSRRGISAASSSRLVVPVLAIAR